MSVALPSVKYGPRPRLQDMRGAVHVNPGRDVYINFGGYRRTFAQGGTGDTLVEFGPFAMAGVASTTCESTNGYLQISSGSADNLYPFVNPNLVGGFGNIQYSEAIAYNNFGTEITNAWQGPAVFINASDGGANVGNYYFADLLRVGGDNITLRLTRRNSLSYTTLGTDYTEAKNYAQKPVHLALEGHDYGAGTRLKIWLNGRLTHDVDDTAATRLGAAVSSGITGQQTSAPGYAWGNNGANDTLKWVLRMRAGNGFYQPQPETGILLPVFTGNLGLPPIGGFVQGDDAQVGNDTTLTATLTNAPKNGNLLIFAVGWHSASATITTPPSGFTLLTTEVGSLATWAWYYKVSDGSETSRSVTISASNTIAIRYNEYEWDNSTPLVATDEDTTNVSSTTNSQNSGTVTPGRGRNFVVAAIGSSDDVDSQTSQSFNNSFIADDDFIGYGGDTADHRIGRIVNQAGPQTTTHTDTDTGAPMYGAIASFTSIDLPVIESITTSGSNTPVEPAVVNYPASGIEAGDLLLMLIGNDGSADLPDFPTGDWDDNKLLRVTPSAGGFGMGVSWKIADGTENGGSENVGFSAGTEEWAGAIIHISNWHGSQPPEISTVASTNSNDSMAVSLDPSWDAANQGNAWIWFLTGDGGAMNVGSWTTIGAAFPDNQTAYSPGAAAPCAAIATSLETTGTKSKSAGTNDLAATDPHAELIIGVRGPVSGPVVVDITDVANSGETPGAGSETWDDGSTGNVITGTGFL